MRNLLLAASVVALSMTSIVNAQTSAPNGAAAEDYEFSYLDEIEGERGE